MAKLGGIKFGAPPGAPPPFRRPQPPPPPTVPEGDAEVSEASPPAPAPNERVEESQEEGEEEEHARRARIATKLAGMGGMRFGMLPMQPAAPEPPRHAKQDSEEHSPAPAMSHPVESDYEFEQQSASSDGVKMEEVHHADAEYQEEPEEEDAPPPPPRPSARPPVPMGRPPIPPPTRKATIESSPQVHPHARGESYETFTMSPPRPPIPPPSSHSEYVMVDDEDDLPPPLPKSRPPPRGPPPPRVPPPAPTPDDNSTSGQWEMPSINFDDAGATSDLSASLWSEDSTAYPSTDAPAPPPPAQNEKPCAPAPPVVPREMSGEQLRAVWGRVGVQMCEVATTLHERSKRTLVGNGSYAGFVHAVLAQVPNAAHPPAGSTEYGYLVYAQTGASVHARADEILPGDVVVLEEARLKGHKGLHAYTLNVGEPGVPGLGVVAEFETKKVKIKALQANQHVGQATVESVSYKLEDLKSGTIKVYRVLEA
ncbi:hypothetical protein OF83DRAFT_470145 [Amylostereum chailletii]|nr:hypothetical protein OF83DRAFT_470145 [Amylostereum chailletii]